MKIRDIIVEQEKPGLLGRAAGALGRHVYHAATGKPYREPKKPVEPVAVQQPEEPSTQAQQTTQQTTQQTAQTTVPVQKGYRTAVIVPTSAGDRKFWYDGKNWREHFGRDWPNDLETSQVVADPTTIQILSKQVQLKNIQQIPYGPRPKNKKKS